MDSASNPLTHHRSGCVLRYPTIKTRINHVAIFSQRRWFTAAAGVCRESGGADYMRAKGFQPCSTAHAFWASSESQTSHEEQLPDHVA